MIDFPCDNFENNQHFLMTSWKLLKYWGSLKFEINEDIFLLLLFIQRIVERILRVVDIRFKKNLNKHVQHCALTLHIVYKIISSQHHDQ